MGGDAEMETTNLKQNGSSTDDTTKPKSRRSSKTNPATPNTPATSSSDLSTSSSYRPNIPRQPSSGDVHNDAILQAMTASEKKSKAKASKGGGGGSAGETSSNVVSSSSLKKTSLAAPSKPASLPAMKAAAAAGAAAAASSSTSATSKGDNLKLKAPPASAATAKPSNVNALAKSPPPPQSSSSDSSKHTLVNSKVQPMVTKKKAPPSTNTTVGPSSDSKLSAISTRSVASSRSANSSASSSPSRQSPLASLQTREATIGEKADAVGNTPTTTTAGASSELKPGAYSIQGGTVARATMGVLTNPQEELTQPQEKERVALAKQQQQQQQQQQQGQSLGRQDEEATSTKKNRSSTSSKKKKSKDSSGKESKKKKEGNLVVAAELTDDIELMMERKIEEEVRKRIMAQAAQAAQADIVSVDHGVSSQHKQRRILPEAEEAKRIADLKETHKPKGVREKLFGDKRQTVDIAASPESIRKRDYLQWTVKRNSTTGQWVASVMTNQKAMQEGDSLEAELSKISYSATTQEEAYETGLANATPLMQSFEENPICFVCKAKFALFRRPCHCRNCGVCICSNCTATWPSRMLPDTYLRKNDKSVLNVCIACDWIANSFQDALLDGNQQAVLDLYATGNVNMRSPFCLDKKGEDQHPIHLAILGGNLDLVRWLTSARYCPLRMQKKKGRKTFNTPLLTSKGRSPLAIALLHQRLDILQYLVCELNQSLFAEEELNTNVALANFTSLLKMLPTSFFQGRQMQLTAVPQNTPNSVSQSFSNCSDASIQSLQQRRPSM